MKTHKPTVTVAISAYNEEGNINYFLKSVIKQKIKNFTLKKILVISDGSTDKTVMKMEPTFSSIDDVSNAIGISVYPNPSSGNITIHFSDLPKVPADFIIVDGLGKTISQGKRADYINRDVLQQRLPDGIYLLQGKVDGKLYHKKIMIHN